MPQSNSSIRVGAVGWREVVPVLRPGWLSVCRCEPGAGKTSLALGLVRDLVARAPEPVRALFISTELTARDVLFKLISAQTGMPFPAVDHDALDDRQRRVVERARDTIASWPLTVVPVNGTTGPDLITVIHRHLDEQSAGFGVIIVDFLDSVVPEGIAAEPDEQLCAHIVALKLLAIEHAIPVIAMATIRATSDEVLAADVVLDLGVLRGDTEDSQREVGLVTARSAEGLAARATLVFDIVRMQHREGRIEVMN